MRLPLILVALALMTPVFAGCMEKAADDDQLQQGTTGSMAHTHAPGVDPNDHDHGTTTPEVTKTPISVAFTASKQWITPGTEVTLTADAQGEGLQYLWQYGLRKGDVTGIDTGSIAAGESADLTFDKTGTYSFHCHPHPWMLLDILVEEGAAITGTAHVAIVDDGETQDSFRYLPREITVAPGTTITFWNNGTTMHTATMSEYKPPLTTIPGNAAEVNFAFPEAGDYRVVLTVTDGADGEGVAEQRVLVDANAPSEVFEKTFNGEIGAAMEQVPVTDGTVEDSVEHTFLLNYPGELTASFTSASGTPVPHQLRMVLRSGTQTLAETEPGTEGTFTVQAPAGNYVLEIQGVQGIEMTYEATVHALLEITPPEPAEDEGHGDGHGHHH